MTSYFKQYKNHPGRNLSGDLMPWILITMVLILVGISLIRFYLYVKQPNVTIPDEQRTYLYIPTGSDFSRVTDLLTSQGYLRNKASFEWLSRRKNYDRKVRPGRYRLREGMDNNELINLLRSGRQEPVKITIQNIRTPEDLAGRLGRILEPDSATFISAFRDPLFLRRYQLTPATLFVFFIPDTYEFFWDTSPEKFFTRMQREFDRFWSEPRKLKAAAIPLTVSEVVTLASIIEKETNKNDEKPVMAGVYLNRLRKKIPLQADPTVIFAWNDYSIRRVLTKHTTIESPYNTYLHTGLPPGPICIPSIASVEAVLNYQPGDYFYFCAREDLSGYHNFSATLAGHNRNARLYQEKLNELNIR
jgi:UPF0755 protein